MSGPVPTQVTRIGPWTAGILYTVDVLMGLQGPFLLVLSFFADEDRRDLRITGLAFTLVFVPVGIGISALVAADRRHNRRLDTVGVPAVAEVTSLTEWEDSEDSGFLVGLRIGGEGLRTFEATWKRSSHPALRVGLRLPAVVDPSDYLFRVDL